MADKNPIKLCECGCGQPTPIATRNWFKKGIIKGQPRKYIQHHRKSKHGYGNNNPTYRSWICMKQRCTNPNASTSLDRYPDQEGNYEPANTRWATEIQQKDNRRNTVWITAFGKTQTIRQWVKETGISRVTLTARIKYNWPIEDALTWHIHQGKH